MNNEIYWIENNSILKSSLLILNPVELYISDSEIDNLYFSNLHNCIYFIKNSNITSNPSLNKFENGNVIEIGLSGNNLNGDYFIDEENILVYSIENGTSTLLVQNLSSSDVSQHSIFGSDQVQKWNMIITITDFILRIKSSPYDI